MNSASPPSRRSVGRPLSFDRDKALYQAMLLFWRHGYEGASITALASAMGVTPPSIYAAFGDKRGLFLEALDLYLGQPAATHTMIAETPTSFAAARAMLDAAIETFTGGETPPGCLLGSAAITGSPASADIQRIVSGKRREIAATLRARIAADISKGALSPTTDADALSDYVIAIIQGLSTLARDGGDRETLRGVANMALRCWPTPDNK